MKVGDLVKTDSNEIGVVLYLDNSPEHSSAAAGVWFFELVSWFWVYDMELEVISGNR